jgi:HSP20 family protein
MTLFDSTFHTMLSDMVSGGWDTVQQTSPTAYLKDDVLTMEFEVPGLSNKDIDVLVEDRTLEIKAEKEHRSFHKRYKIHDAFDINQTSASAKDGILIITIPKYEDRKAKRIDVKVK